MPFPEPFDLPIDLATLQTNAIYLDPHMSNSASAQPSSPTNSAVLANRRDANNDQAESGARIDASPAEKRGLLQELASVFMDSGADIAKESLRRETKNVSSTSSAGSAASRSDADQAQVPRHSVAATDDDEHLLQAMKNLSLAVERNSTELGEFRAAQQKLQEQTLQVLTQMMAMKNDEGRAPQSLIIDSNDDKLTRKGRAEGRDDDDSSFSLKTNTDANGEDKEEETDQSQELERKRDRLDGLEVYAVVSALSAGTMVAVFDSYQPSGATGGDVIDLFQRGKYLEFLMSAIFIVAGSVGIVCSLHCIFVFSLVTMYGRTAIGMDRDDALDTFFAGTGVQRFHGFKTFVGSLYALMFELIVVITSKVSDKPFVHLTAIVLTSRLMYNVYSDTQIIIDKASVIFALRPRSSSDSTNDEDDTSLSLSLGSTGHNDDEDESISVPELISDKQNSLTDTTTTQGTSVLSLPTSLNLRYSSSMKRRSSDRQLMERRSSDRRLSGVSSMNLGAEELIIQEQKEETQKKDRAKILVVDDSAVSRRLLAKRVEKLDHVADQAADGEEALKILREGAVAGKANQYDLVLLDMFMPKLNGDEVLEEMQKSKDLQNIPVIMISGNEDVSQKAKCIELGASDFLPKPFDGVIFKARVVACLQAKRLRDLQDSSDDASAGVEGSASSCVESTNTNGSFRSLDPTGSGKKSASYRRRLSSGTSMNVGAEQLMREQQEAKQIPKILVVDDSATSRRLLSKRVEKLGHEVRMACDGQQALDILQGTEPGKSGERIDLVLLDMFMPNLNGDEVLEKMKKDDALKNIPVIMISGAEDVSQKARCIELGASDFLPKPFDPIIFKARVVACLRAKRIQERRRSIR